MKVISVCAMEMPMITAQYKYINGNWSPQGYHQLVSTWARPHSSFTSFVQFSHCFLTNVLGYFFETLYNRPNSNRDPNGAMHYATGHYDIWYSVEGMVQGW